jgi:hypothetical protein
MSDFSRALLIGGIVGLGLSPFILAIAWLPMRRRSADEEVSPEQRKAVLRNVIVGVVVVVAVAAGGFWFLEKHSTEGNTTGAMSGGMPGGAPGIGGPNMSGGGSMPQMAMPQLPQSLAGVPLVDTLTGDDALQQVDSMHPSEFPLSGATVGYYKNADHESTMWVAMTPSEQMGPAMSASMADAIGNNDTPFGTPQQMDGGVWKLEGLGQVHYFFPAGASVWWISADKDVAAKSLAQAQQAAGL